MSLAPDFEALFRASPYPHMVVNRDLNFVAANDAYLRILGRVGVDLRGQYLFAAFPDNPDDPASTGIGLVRDSILRAFETGQPHTIAFVRYAIARETADGTVFDERYWSTVHTPVAGPDGQTAFVMQNSIEVTELYRFDRDSHVASVAQAPRLAERPDHFYQAQMHEAMMRIVNDERSHLRGLFNQAPGFIAVLSGERHVFEMVNQAYYQLVGHRELIGKPVWQALPEVSGQGYDALLDGVYSTGEPFVGRNLKVQLQPVPNGPLIERFIDVLYQPMKNKEGRVSGIFVQGHDVTDAHTAQLAEMESAERLSEGMNAAQMMVWDWEIGTRKMVFSDNAQLVLGRSEGNIDVISESIHPEDAARLRSERERAIAECGGYREIVRFRRPDDGRMLWLDIRGKVRCDAEGKPFSVRGVTLDVTDRIRAEEDLRDAHRRKDEFLAMLAHELRNPLAPISSAAQLLRHVRHSEQRLAEITDIIIRQVGHITGLVDDLIDVSRVTRGLISTEQQPQDLHRIIGDALEQVRPLMLTRRHQLSVELPANPVRIMGDQKRVVQVLTNLLGNAAKYTPEGGIIDLSMQYDDTHVHLRLRDNGIGIEPDLLPRVFDLFTQGERSADRAQGGLGVGLAVVKSLAELHGGQVSAASEGRGKGSTFTLTLPLLCAGPELAALPVEADVPGPQRPMRIMVVDDNPDAACMLSMLLEQSGYSVSTENTPEAALARVAVEAPDVCLLDIGLPGMDGYQLARALRALPGMEGATLIAITGYGQEQDRRKTAEAGFQHHLVKPVDSAELGALLQGLAAARWEAVPV
ncbi:ATP-binding protein [Massilia sp. CF038]|uniref:hybrid sensor histidine kinase/response regulator n=1 Tax=Massilia sp. CF038 TaxID=1881045 RepID=UPI00091F0EB3|nr:ATP-binding protein [Massilia sp. CF038]SHG54273.1 PAS domain S-box-containing protein [Massilia sp. CF038]